MKFRNSLRSYGLCCWRLQNFFRSCCYCFHVGVAIFHYAGVGIHFELSVVVLLVGGNQKNALFLTCGVSLTCCLFTGKIATWYMGHDFGGKLLENWVSQNRTFLAFEIYFLLLELLKGWCSYFPFNNNNNNCMFVLIPVSLSSLSTMSTIGTSPLHTNSTNRLNNNNKY